MSLKSGRDTTVAGATVTGGTVTADVGGNLSVESRQDTLTSRNSQTGFSLGIGLGSVSTTLPGPTSILGQTASFLPDGYTPNTGILSQTGTMLGNAGTFLANGGPFGSTAAGQLSNSGTPGPLKNTGSIGFTYVRGSEDKAWTNQQTTINGTNGTTLNVTGNTNVKGAIVESASGPLNINTGTFTYENIKDYDKTSNINASVNVTIPLGSFDWQKNAPDTSNGGGQPAAPQPPAQSMLAQLEQGLAQAGQFLGQYQSKLQVAYKATDKEGTTFATVGQGAINVSDTAKQAALEKSGATGALDLLNRDASRTQIITKNKTDAFNVYVSTEALRYAAKGISALADYLTSTGTISKEAAALLKEIEKNPKAQISASCGGDQQGFNIFNLLISPAYAQEKQGCTVTIDTKTFKLSPDGETMTCLDALLLVAQQDPSQTEALKRLLLAVVRNVTAGGSILNSDATSNPYAIQLFGAKSETLQAIYNQLLESGDAEQLTALKNTNPGLVADLEVARMINLGITDPNSKIQVRATLFTIFTSGQGNYVKQYLEHMEILSPASMALFEAAHYPKGTPQYDSLNSRLTYLEQVMSDPGNALSTDIGVLRQYVATIRNIQQGNASETDYANVLFQGSWGQQEGNVVRDTTVGAAMAWLAGEAVAASRGTLPLTEATRETVPPPQRGGGTDFYVDSKARATSNLAELDQPVTAKGGADEASMSKMKGDLAASQAYDARLGTTLEDGRAPITVTADGSVAGQTITDTNQMARPTSLADANKPTLVADLVGEGNPNSNMANAHAEIAVIQRAADAGLTQGQEMTVVVRGKEICSFCQDVLADMADRAGLTKSTVVDGEAGTTYTWTRPAPSPSGAASSAKLVPYDGPAPTGQPLWYPLPPKQ